jgi:hypothetical protein
MVIELRVELLHVPLAVVAVADMGATLHIPLRHTPHMVLVLVVLAVVVVHPVPVDQNGLNQVRLYHIRLHKYSRLHQFVKLLNLEQQHNLIFEMYFFVTHGETVRKRQKNLMICLWRLV